MAFLFDKELYDSLKINITIHRKLLELADENIQQTVKKLLIILALCRCIIDIASFSPKNIEQLVELFINLQNSKPSDTDNYLHLLPQCIVRCIHTREKRKMSALYFLRCHLRRNSISIISIVNELNKLPPYFQTKDAQLLNHWAQIVFLETYSQMIWCLIVCRYLLFILFQAAKNHQFKSFSSILY